MVSRRKHKRSSALATCAELRAQLADQDSRGGQAAENLPRAAKLARAVCALERIHPHPLHNPGAEWPRPPTACANLSPSVLYPSHFKTILTFSEKRGDRANPEDELAFLRMNSRSWNQGGSLSLQDAPFLTGWEGGGRSKRWTQGTHLSEVQLHLLPQELGLVQLQPGVCRRQGAAEVYSDPFEALEVLEGDVLVICPKERFKLGLENKSKRSENLPPRHP